jgi:DNA-binding transcriptional ArsR family regulator
MSRAPTTSDVFNAIAEPRRRQIVTLLAAGPPRSVGDLVEAMELPQPAVSKHLAVLRTVGVVSVQKVGKSRLYALNPTELKTVHDWISQFEKLWEGQLDRIKLRAEQKAKERAQKN